jgi:hypothetical protein
VTNLATPEEVNDITGKSVSSADIARAQAMVEDATGVDLSPDPLPAYYTRDLRLLKRAIIWQTAYLDDHPDLLSREPNLTSASTNGNSMSWGEGGSAATLLAPLADMSLRRLSWRRSRSIPLVRAPDQPKRAQTLVNDGLDSEWMPLR